VVLLPLLVLLILIHHELLALKFDLCFGLFWFALFTMPFFIYICLIIQKGISNLELVQVKIFQKKPFLDGPMLDFRGVFLVDFLKIGEQRNNQNQWFPHEKMTNSLG
jgi:hypothetical protein